MLFEYLEESSKIVGYGAALSTRIDVLPDFHRVNSPDIHISMYIPRCSFDIGYKLLTCTNQE